MYYIALYIAWIVIGTASLGVLCCVTDRESDNALEVLFLVILWPITLPYALVKLAFNWVMSYV